MNYRATTACALWALLLALPIFAADAASTRTAPLLPRGVKLPAGVAVPNDTALAVYFPQEALEFRFYMPMFGAWVDPGQALEDSRAEVIGKLFPGALAAAPGQQGAYGLLLTMHPEWKSDSGQMRLSMHYRVLDAAGSQLREATLTEADAVAGNPGALKTLLHKTVTGVLVEVLRELRPSAARFPATGQVASIAPERFVRRKEPFKTGTAFFVNESGQLLTAAHVIRDCVTLEATAGDRAFPVSRRADSDLLDLAVVDSGQSTTMALPLRVGQRLILGEAVTNVGYPLAGLLANTPNVTRGNVSARAGLRGSEGLFQFSAPIQPGSSGGPVVSDGGELLGVTVGTLNLAGLVNQGVLPQNVNFALDARHVAAFLKREGIAFSEIEPVTTGGLGQANEAALAAVVQLSCYQ
ncbi:MAG: S1 family peptidase [Steroidobacteraceae bacterium]